ncbi:hypothetical protein Tco_0661439 [Tanacetum coccineum]
MIHPELFYEDKSKKKRLMCVDKIHKFCDGKSVQNILHQRLKNFSLGYNKDMPLREWTTKDKRRTCIMLNKINDQLFKRRVLKSLEVLVGGRKIETDKQLLQRIVVKIRYDTKGVKVKMGNNKTKTKLTLEQTQQGVSDEVLVSIKGVEE